VAPVGGMWVEPDMNCQVAESIVRQLIFGQRYFESAVRGPPVLWCGFLSVSAIRRPCANLQTGRVFTVHSPRS